MLAKLKLWNLRRRLENSNAETRLAAIHELGDRVDPRLVDSLLSALADENASVCRAAAVALGHAGDARAVEGLVRVRVHADEQVRKAASDALQRIDPDWPASAGAKAVVPHLLNTVKGPT